MSALSREDIAALATVMREVFRDELAAGKVDRFGAVDALVARLDRAYGEVPAPGVPAPGQTNNHTMFEFVRDLRAAIQAERSAR